MLHPDTAFSIILTGAAISALCSTVIFLAFSAVGWDRGGAIAVAAVLMVIGTLFWSGIFYSDNTHQKIDSISEEYGYSFSPWDRAKMRGFFPAEVVLELDTPAGSDQKVLMRLVGNEHIPWIMGDDGEWVRAQPLQDAPG